MKLFLMNQNKFSSKREWWVYLVIIFISLGLAPATYSRDMGNNKNATYAREQAKPLNVVKRTATDERRNPIPLNILPSNPNLSQNPGY